MPSSDRRLRFLRRAAFAHSHRPRRPQRKPRHGEAELVAVTLRMADTDASPTLTPIKVAGISVAIVAT